MSEGLGQGRYTVTAAGEDRTRSLDVVLCCIVYWLFLLRFSMREPTRSALKHSLRELPAELYRNNRPQRKLVGFLFANETTRDCMPTFLPTALLCMLTSIRFEFFLLFHGASVNHLLKIIPKLISSPQPPHLNSPGGGSFGIGPQLHFDVTPLVQAFAMDCVKEAADRA